MHSQCVNLTSSTPASLEPIEGSVGASVAFDSSKGPDAAPSSSGRLRPSRKQSLLSAAQTAADQYGAITRRQLLSAGVTQRQIDRRMAVGSLTTVARGVYFVAGVTPTWEQRAVAAVLVTHARAYEGALSHESAAAVHGLPGYTRSGTILLSINARDRHPNPLAIMSRMCDLLEEDVIDGPLGVPITSVARTVLDLATQSSRIDTAQAIISGAVEAGKTTLDELEHRFGQARRRSGIIPVRKALLRARREADRRIRAEKHLREKLARREQRRTLRMMERAALDARLTPSTARSVSNLADVGSAAA